MGVMITAFPNPRQFLNRTMARSGDNYTAARVNMLRQTGIPDIPRPLTVTVDPPIDTYGLGGKIRRWRLVPAKTAQVWQAILGAWGVWKTQSAYDAVALYDEKGKHELFLICHFPFTAKKATGPPNFLYAPEGILYLQEFWTVQPCPLPQLSMWAGVGLKGGACAYVGGFNWFLGFVFSVNEPGKHFWFKMSTAELGPSGGIDGSVAAVLIPGLKGASDLNHHVQSGVDWSVSLGLGWGDWIKDAGKLAETRLDKLAQKVLESHGAFIGLAKTVNGAMAFDPDRKEVWMVDLFGVGAMVKLTWCLSQCYAPVNPLPAAASDRGGGGIVHYNQI